jgi:hypothetical protein
MSWRLAKSLWLAIPSLSELPDETLAIDLERGAAQGPIPMKFNDYLDQSELPRSTRRKRNA